MIKNFNREIFSSSRQAIFSLNLALLYHSIWPDNDVKDYTDLELEYEYNRIKQKKQTYFYFAKIA
jgi:hypothetical protein